MPQPLKPELLRSLAAIDGCTIANSIETFDVRLRNTGFTDSSVHCVFGELPPVIGYAATARVRTADPPMEGIDYLDRTEWWNHILTVPEPRIVVVQDMDHPPGLGAFVGELHVNILMALGCIGVVTNGAVRDLKQVRAAGFQLHAGNVSVSHAYAHVFDFGHSIEVGHMKVSPGDLLHGDLHGVQTIPAEIAAEIPGVARHLTGQKEQLIELCRSKAFSVPKIREAVREMKIEIKHIQHSDHPEDRDR
jgi:4-hydroxy-4-methyl-2-oxoglutarate aldolase